MIARLWCFIWHHDWYSRGLFMDFRECLRCGSQQKYDWKTHRWENL